MYSTKCERFPNGEIRVTTYREKLSSRTNIGAVDDNEKSDSTLTCHSLKTLNGSQNADKQGDSVSVGTAGYGRLGRRTSFSTYGRRAILRAGAAIERAVPKEECDMLTLTVPGSTGDALRVVASYSSYLVQRLKAWIGKRVKSPLSLYCWEWQKRGALHLHLVQHFPDRAAEEYIRTNLKSEWTRLLNAIALKSGIDVWKRQDGTTWRNSTGVLRVECAPVKKSVAAYLAKYLSKGRDEYKGFGAQFFHPTRWYGISRPLLELTREMTETYIHTSGRLSEALAMHEDCLYVLQREALRWHHWKHEIGNGVTTVAYFPNNTMESTWNQIMQIVPQPIESATTLGRRSLNFCLNSKALMTRYPVWRHCFEQLSSDYVRRMDRDLSPSLSMSGLDMEYLVDTYTFSLTWYQRTRSNIPATLSAHLTRGLEIQRQWSTMAFRCKLDMTLGEVSQ